MTTQTLNLYGLISWPQSANGRPWGFLLRDGLVMTRYFATQRDRRAFIYQHSADLVMQEVDSTIQVAVQR